MTSSCWRSLCSRWDPPRRLQQFCVVSHRLVRLWPIEVSRWAIPRLYPIFILWPLRHSNQRERENLLALLNGTKTINYNKYVPLFGVNSFDINLEHLEQKSCTTRQLYGITQPMLTLWLTAGENLCQCQWKLIDNIWEASCDPLTKFNGRPSFFPVPVRISPEKADSPNCSKGSSLSHLWWSRSAVNCCCMQFTIRNQSGNHANQYPALSYWNYCSVLRLWAFHQRKMWKISEVTQGATLKVMHRVGETSNLTQGRRGYRLKTITSKEDHALLRIMRGTGFSQHPGSGWSPSGEFIIVTS